MSIVIKNLLRNTNHPSLNNETEAAYGGSIHYPSLKYSNSISKVNYSPIKNIIRTSNMKSKKQFINTLSRNESANLKLNNYNFKTEVNSNI